MISNKKYNQKILNNKFITFFYSKFDMKNTSGNIFKNITKIKKIHVFIILVIMSIISGCTGQNTNNDNFETALVTKVVDGDTINVKINGEKYKVRMIGVDTPETVHPSKPIQFYGKEASDYTKKNLTDKTVYLQKDVSDTDRHGRLLRYVWISKPSNDNPSNSEIRKNMYNAILVENGYAHSVTYQPDSRYSKLFSELQSIARKNKLGLWDENLEKAFNKRTIDKSSNSDSNTQHEGSNSKLTKNSSSKKNSNINEKDTDNTKNDTQNITGKIKGNKKSKIYHFPGTSSYNQISEKNTVYFDSEKDAISAGYRKSNK